MASIVYQMNSSVFFLIIVVIILCQFNRIIFIDGIDSSHVQDTIAESNSTNEYWTKRREQFYNNNTFDLSDVRLFIL